MRILYTSTIEINDESFPAVKHVELEFFMNGIEFLNNRPTIEQVISQEYIEEFTFDSMTDGEPLDGWDYMSSMKELFIEESCYIDGDFDSKTIRHIKF